MTWKSRLRIRPDSRPKTEAVLVESLLSKVGPVNSDYKNDGDRSSWLKLESIPGGRANLSFAVFFIAPNYLTRLVSDQSMLDEWVLCKKRWTLERPLISGKDFLSSPFGSVYSRHFELYCALKHFENKGYLVNFFDWCFTFANVDQSLNC